MKMLTNQKEMNYSLHNIENFKKDIQVDISKISQKYSELLIEYFKFILENIKTKNNNFTKYIIIRGVDTITNVFLNLFLYTKNIDITYFHCQKSFYFYVEFVGQISEDEKMFLQLTSRDASVYVYKKTIFEITNEFKKINDDISNETKEKIQIINSYVNVYKMYIYKIIENNNETTNDKYIELFYTISDKLNNLFNKNKIKIYENILDKLYLIENIELFFNINTILVKKFIKNSDILDNCVSKLNKEDLINKSNESAEKFISWIFQ
jgi:hypothetical protein